MRDIRFVAEHRGGLLKKEDHCLLMNWACDCAEHVFPLYGDIKDLRVKKAISAGRDWAEGIAPVGDAIKAAREVHSAAGESTDSLFAVIARSVGHAAATAHMADHCVGAAGYALKAVRIAGKPVDEERKWEGDKLSLKVRELVLSAREMKRI